MRIYKLLLAAVVGITWCLLFLTGMLYAQEPALKAEPDSLILKDGFGADREYWTEFDLVATAGVTNLSSRNTGLANEDGTVRLRSSHVTLEPTGITTLATGERRRMMLTVSGVEKAGTYTGELRIGYSTAAGPDELVVSIILEVTDPWLEIIEGDEGLNLVGPVGASTRFEDGFRLVARGGDLASVTFEASDLTDDDKVIRFGKVALEPSTQPLPEDEVKTFKLVVTGVDEPGTYRGQLRILKPGERSTQGLTIPIQLTAEGTPQVDKVPKTAKLEPSLIRCRAGLECWLAQRLLGQASTQTTREMRLENTSLVSASLQQPEVTDVKGQTGEYQLTAEDFEFDMSDLGGGTLPSKDSGVLRVTVVAAHIPPDEYKGIIRIPVQDQDSPVSVDVDLKIRGGLFLPIILIVGGWLLGHVIKLYPAAEARSRLWLWANALEGKIKKVDNASKKEAFLGRLENVRQKINAAKLEEAKKDLEELDHEVDQELEAQAKGVRIEGLLLADLAALERRRALSSRVRQILGWLSGIAPEAEALFTLWILRPLLYFLLVVWITYLGFQQKYIGQATFGANPVSDYVGLITWAMSADIVGRTIAKIGQE